MSRIFQSRTRILLVALAAILLLDLGRSILARNAMSEPAAVWRPDPAVYSDTVWPPSAAVLANASPAQKLYTENCAICHGPDGRGNGASAPSMIPRPRDFTQGQFKYKTTAAGAPPSDDDLYRVISDGLAASAMPAWADLLKPDEIKSLVAYIKAMSPTFTGQTPAPARIAPRGEPTPASVARGEKLYKETGCAQCHGDDLRGGVSLHDAKNYPVVSRDLTAPWTYRGGSAPEQIWLRLTTGLMPSPMPSFAEALNGEQRWDIVNFLISRQRIAPWAPSGALEGPGHKADLEARGRYLIHAEMCGLCHTEVDPGGIYRDDRYLAGGMRVGANPQGVFISRNLTSDRETGLGDWSEAEIADALRNGRARNGRLINLWGMPWMYLHSLSSDDATAIARHLKTLPPVHNAIPETLHYGLFETIARKLATGSFPIAAPPVLTYAVGSYANRTGVAPDRIQGGLIAAQWALLLLAMVAIPFAAPRGKRLPSRVRGWFAALGALLLLVACLAFGWFAYSTPTLSVMPPDRVAAGATKSIFAPDVAAMPPERAAIIKRGQYLFTIASCAYCHLNDGSGGFKVSGGNGSIFTPNISSDGKAGIGAWSDQQIARAIRSGVSRNGRPLYWQGMPWDHFSNWDEEDVRSLVAYLRLLPPVSEMVPTYRPPAPDDCKEYTFWTHKTKEPGCKG